LAKFLIKAPSTANSFTPTVLEGIGYGQGVNTMLAIPMAPLRPRSCDRATVQGELLIKCISSFLNKWKNINIINTLERLNLNSISWAYFIIEYGSRLYKVNLNYFRI